MSSPDTKPDCIEGMKHRYRIEEPNGQVSMGTCQYCGYTREYKNWFGETEFTTNREWDEVGGSHWRVFGNLASEAYA